MSIGVYQANGEDAIHVATLTSDAQSKITGVKDNRLKLIEKDLQTAITKISNDTKR